MYTVISGITTVGSEWVDLGPSNSKGAKGGPDIVNLSGKPLKTLLSYDGSSSTSVLYYFSSVLQYFTTFVQYFTSVL